MNIEKELSKLNFNDEQQILNYCNDGKFTFFFHQSSPFSQWYICNFHDDMYGYNCMEQYMMYHKALLFKDYDTANKIIKFLYTPKQYKQFGRQVKNFDSKIWDQNKIKIVMKGNMLKFGQNPDLKEILLSTKGTMLVEASPYDKIWGCGLSENDNRIHDYKNWTGQNILGSILTVIRDGFLKEEDNGTVL